MLVRLNIHFEWSVIVLVQSILTHDVGLIINLKEAFDIDVQRQHARIKNSEIDIFTSCYSKRPVSSFSLESHNDIKLVHIKGLQCGDSFLVTTPLEHIVFDREDT